jgi:hypothetical protein
MKYNQISKTTSFSDFLDKFNNGEINSFGTWNDHVKSWLDNTPRNFIVVKYENLIESPHSKLKEILRSAGLKICEDKLEKALHASNFMNMRRIEMAEYSQCSTLDGSDSKKFFVRSATPGEWRKYFSQEMHDDFLAVHGSALSILGYY